MTAQEKWEEKASMWLRDRGWGNHAAPNDIASFASLLRATAEEASREAVVEGERLKAEALSRPWLLECSECHGRTPAEQMNSATSHPEADPICRACAAEAKLKDAEARVERLTAERDAETDENGQAVLLAEVVLRAYRSDADAFIKLFGSNGPALGAQNVQSQERELARLERILAVYEEHEQNHVEAVDECTHDEKTWVCCGACHCVAIQKRQASEAQNRALVEALENAWGRMDRARAILRQGQPTGPIQIGGSGQFNFNNWGILDTTLDREALDKAKEGG